MRARGGAGSICQGLEGVQAVPVRGQRGCRLYLSGARGGAYSTCQGLEGVQAAPVRGWRGCMQYLSGARGVAGITCQGLEGCRHPAMLQPAPHIGLVMACLDAH